MSIESLKDKYIRKDMPQFVRTLLVYIFLPLFLGLEFVGKTMEG